MVKLEWLNIVKRADTVYFYLQTLNFNSIDIRPEPNSTVHQNAAKQAPRTNATKYLTFCHKVTHRTLHLEGGQNRDPGISFTPTSK